MNLATHYQRQVHRDKLSQLISVESYDPDTRCFYLNDGYLGCCYVSQPLQSGDEAITQRLNVLFSFDYPANSFMQVLLMATPDLQGKLDAIEALRTTQQWRWCINKLMVILSLSPFSSGRSCP